MEKVDKEKTDVLLVGRNETCWFCSVQQPSITASYKFYMNKGWGRENEIIAAYTARCRKCKRMHFQQHLLTWVIFIGMCFSLMSFISSSKGILNDIFCVSIFMLMFKSVWSDYFIVRLSKKMGIRSTRVKDLRNHPEISQYISTGWGFGEPSI